MNAAGLPQPLVDHRLGPYLVDFYWPEQRLVVETDGGTHRHERARRRDAARDGALMSEGMRVIRFGSKDVARAPMRVVAELSRQLRT